jgi:hypothetical protein
MMAIVGPSFSGKTSLAAKLIEHREFCIDKPVRSIHYFYNIFQEKFNEIERSTPNITFHKGLPTQDQIDEISDPNYLDMIVLDDLGSIIGNSEFMHELSVCGVHHRNLFAVTSTVQGSIEKLKIHPYISGPC